MSRLSSVRHFLESEGAKAIVFSSLADIRWLTGFAGSHGLLVVTEEETTLITDGRYELQARNEASESSIRIAPGDPFEFLVAENIVPADGTIVLQGDHVTARQYEYVRAASSATVRLKDGVLQRARARKDEFEIDLITRAQRISESVLEEILGMLRPGVQELEVAAEIVARHLTKGASAMAFEPIVASGTNSAMPHARPGMRRIGLGDVVLLDFGCQWNGYASDMTRTVVIGPEPEDLRKVYGVVLDAQQRALDAARAGLRANELDEIARKAIAEAGFGECFPHGLGHGVGLEVHEWPRVSSRSTDRLPVGAVITIEPGVYIKGRFGVRIEDMIVLQPGGSKNLTNAPRNLIVL